MTERLTPGQFGALMRAEPETVRTEPTLVELMRMVARTMPLTDSEKRTLLEAADHITAQEDTIRRLRRMLDATGMYGKDRREVAQTALDAEEARHALNSSDVEE